MQPLSSSLRLKLEERSETSSAETQAMNSSRGDSDGYGIYIAIPTDTESLCVYMLCLPLCRRGRRCHERGIVYIPN